MSKYIYILLATLWIFITIPDPARGYEWPDDPAYASCQNQWEGYLVAANAQGRVIMFDDEFIKLFADAASKENGFGVLPLRYLLAFESSVVAYIFRNNEQPNVVYYVGIWDTKNCDGAIITIPNEIYDTLMNRIGQGV